MLQLGSGTLRVMNMETGEDLGVINELPEVQTGGIVDKPIIGVDLCNSCEGSITVKLSAVAMDRLLRLSCKGYNNWRKRHHIPLMRKIYRR